jgi:CelD/BcsL family acetyltransferase involved in cellulose biosynthesis
MARSSECSAAGGFVLHARGAVPLEADKGLHTLYGHARTPFVTLAWTQAWWEAFGKGDRVLATWSETDGEPAAAAWLRRAPGGGLVSPTNAHSGDWDALAASEMAREHLWEGLAAAGARWVRLEAMRTQSESLEAAQAAFSRAGYRVVVEEGARSPYLELPGSFDELMAGMSRNHRSQVGRRRRSLEREGELTFRTITGGAGLDDALASVFEVEASGWKARAGTAILREPGAEELYRTFARAGAREGILRIHLLELDGRAIAGDLGAVVGGVGYLLKTGFDEDWSRLSPGLVLRADVLRASIEEGLTGYDFLGPDDPYKLRWTETVRPRATLRAFRGAAALPGLTWRRRLRPALKRARDAVRAR